MKMPNPRHVYESASFYPLTALYLVGVVTAFLVVNDVLPALYGVITFSLAVVIAMLAAAYREIRTVHRLVARLEREALANLRRNK